MGVKISALPDASTLDGSELVPIDQAAETRKTTTGDIAALVPPSSDSFSGVALALVGFRTIGATSSESAPFSDARYDTDGYWNSSDSITINVPHDGFYHVSTCITWDVAGVASVSRYAEIHAGAWGQVCYVQNSYHLGDNSLIQTMSGDCSLGAGAALYLYVFNDGPSTDYRAILQLHRIGPPPAPPPPPAFLLRDRFVDADGTAISAHAMIVGPGWTVDVGAATIETNAVVPTLGTEVVIFSDAGVADVVVKARFTTPASGALDFAILVNVADGNNYWLFQGSSTASQWRLFEMTGGSFTLHGTSTVTLTHATTYVLSAHASGDTIDCFVGGALVLTYTAGGRPHQADTSAGYRWDATIDNGTSSDSFAVTG